MPMTGRQSVPASQPGAAFVVPDVSHPDILTDVPPAAVGRP
jgi:hypothetical protein